MLIQSRIQKPVNSAGAQLQTTRVLHVVESLDDQAVESWLLRVAGVAAKEFPQIKWTFFCVRKKAGRRDDFARALGFDVIHSRYEVGDKLRFVRSLRQIMKNGHYDILHCHHDVMSAMYLLASRGLPFKRRIVHVHNTSLSLPTPNRLKADMFREPMRQVCLRMADQIIGISKEALGSMIQNGPMAADRLGIVHYAVDTARFAKATITRSEFREQLGWPDSAKVMLFVGRICDYKNPAFVLDILEQITKTDSSVTAVFAGTGNQMKDVAALAENKSLGDCVRFLGFRNDIPDIMHNCDILIWPSLEEPKEGLGLGIVEAQAAGLPVLMSRSVPMEAVVIPELVDSMPLSDGAQRWASRVIEILGRQRPAKADCLARVETSSFSMNAGVSNLMSIYEH